jgi:hypothetical protein
MNAIRRLTEFGAPGREMLETIADGDEVTDEMARETARAQLTGETG